MVNRGGRCYHSCWYSYRLTFSFSWWLIPQLTHSKYNLHSHRHMNYTKKLCGLQFEQRISAMSHPRQSRSYEFCCLQHWFPRDPATSHTLPDSHKISMVMVHKPPTNTRHRGYKLSVLQTCPIQREKWWAFPGLTVGAPHWHLESWNPPMIGWRDEVTAQS